MSTQSLTPYCDQHGHLWECYTDKDGAHFGQCLRCRKWPTPEEIDAAFARRRLPTPEPEPVAAVTQEGLFEEPQIRF